MNGCEELLKSTSFANRFYKFFSQSSSVLFFTLSFFASSLLYTAIANVIYILILRTLEIMEFSFLFNFPPCFFAQRVDDTITITLYIVVLGSIVQCALE